MDMKTIGSVKDQWKHEDDPDSLEKPRGATLFLHSSPAVEKTLRDSQQVFSPVTTLRCLTDSNWSSVCLRYDWMSCATWFILRNKIPAVFSVCQTTFVSLCCFVNSLTVDSLYFIVFFLYPQSLWFRNCALFCSPVHCAPYHYFFFLTWFCYLLQSLFYDIVI